MNAPTPTARSLRIRVHGHAGKPLTWEDEVAVEEPLEIQVDTRSLAVTMRTPGHDEELAAGFLLSEGMIRSAGDLKGFRPHPRNDQGNVLGVFLESHVTVNWPAAERHVYVSSSCGLCGKASIDAVRQVFPKVRSRAVLSHAVLLRLPGIMRAAQETFSRTGGLHAAGLFNLRGELLVLREDVGRHNAVDKVLGHALLENWLPLRNHLLLVSGRSSFEIVQKALAAGLPIVAAVSAPSSLAVECAEAGGVTLVGFLRAETFNVYTHVRRIIRAARPGGGSGTQSTSSTKKKFP